MQNISFATVPLFIGHSYQLSESPIELVLFSSDCCRFSRKVYFKITASGSVVLSVDTFLQYSFLRVVAGRLIEASLTIGFRIQIVIQTFIACIRSHFFISLPVTDVLPLEEHAAYSIL